MASVALDSPDNIIRNFTLNQKFSQKYNIPLLVLGILTLLAGAGVGGAGFAKVLRLSRNASLTFLAAGAILGLGFILAAVYKNPINKCLFGKETREHNQKQKTFVNSFRTNMRLVPQYGDCWVQKIDKITKHEICSFDANKQNFDQVCNLVDALIDRCTVLNVKVYFSHIGVSGLSERQIPDSQKLSLYWTSRPWYAC